MIIIAKIVGQNLMSKKSAIYKILKDNYLLQEKIKKQEILIEQLNRQLPILGHFTYETTNKQNLLYIYGIPIDIVSKILLNAKEEGKYIKVADLLDKINNAGDRKKLEKIIDQLQYTYFSSGEWIDNRCSVCNYGVQPWNNTEFCPRCGAIMSKRGVNK